MVIVGLMLLFQCPCSGGKANPLLLLATVAGIWLLARWITSVLRNKGVSKMNKIGKIAVVVVLIAAVVVVIAVKQNQAGSRAAAPADAARQTQTDNEADQTVGHGLPALVDLGAGRCIPCKMMAPILENLKTEYAGSLKVQVIDVEKNTKLAQHYRVWVIPTQIFFDASGKELFRHEGFISKEDILAKWAELGVELKRTK